jgi:hypothetical protein
MYVTVVKPETYSYTEKYFLNKTCTQCCGAGAESQGAEINCPPGAGAEIMNCGSGFGSFPFSTDLKKLYFKKIMVAEEVIVNYYNFNPISKSEEDIFKVLIL